MSRRVQGVLGLWTLVKIALFMGLFFGLLSLLLGVVMFGERYPLGVFIAQPFFFSLSLIFIVLVGYLPYRWLARRRRFGLHTITYSPD
ncbi:MAG: hypothetical protein KGJ44_09510 [Betaproteobacteria bacterium]|nr:hypothetical protein [Betaproteobacteria bacterium]MDE2048633.1 hypothetical protein [Betaproteobacteria bacterium]